MPIDAQQVYWYRGDSVVCNDCAVYSFEAKEWQSVYYCVAENADGICSDTCIYKVSVYNIPTDVWLPTAFSPNGDGRNESFKVITDNPNFIMHSLSVYNRWGSVSTTVRIIKRVGTALITAALWRMGCTTGCYATPSPVQGRIFIRKGM